jgi:hypothetical protein
VIGVRSRILRLTAGAALAVACGAAPPAQLDSELVLQRYVMALDAVTQPKNVVFSYTVSQLGPSNLEQRHRIYRSGSSVRDETIAVDGVALRRKIVRISHRQDRYAVDRLAPKAAEYQMLFLTAARDGAHDDYTFELTPLVRRTPSSVDSLTIDGARFLPRLIRFHTASGDAQGTAEVRYAPFGPYWMPVLATIDARVAGKPARERITWEDYRFPETLPPSTFSAARRLPSGPR